MIINYAQLQKVLKNMFRNVCKCSEMKKRKSQLYKKIQTVCRSTPNCEFAKQL